MYYGVVVCDYYGTVEEAAIQKDSRIYEWEPLFYIKTSDGITKVIHQGISGEIVSLEVAKGDRVVPGMVLAFVKEDLFVSASD
ncbi:hypothetical protein ACFCYN_05175 [Gottfriedia sp. NPDC056225]|uniref:hypothetical protein n=1 Tax=Gottfriedia sp. NPDC056225 TaxID=3345751 RepID=UPI0015595E25|nr:hypothetical protein HPK19_20090 [Arthrobacter citreus]